ncbi:MAG: hypothetical protein Q9181_004741, partial [Wetmoreana brouardii]
MSSPSGCLMGFLLLLLHTAPLCAQPLVNRANIVGSASGLKQQYDYVVVGGGTSGLTVANRLTEDKSGTLLGRDHSMSETFTPPPAEIASEYPISSDLGPHGTDGPVQSSFPNYQYPVLKYFYKAWNSIGVPSNPQPNAGRAVDAFYSTLSISALNQSRSSADTAYFRPIADKRPNFHLLPLHSVTKIVIDKKNKKATGVQYVSVNNTNIVQTVRASKEVIVAAGAPRSPQILQLSGIGPKKLLTDLRIEAIEDLPGVGYNFHDQPAMFTQVT